MFEGEVAGELGPEGHRPHPEQTFWEVLRRVRDRLSGDKVPLLFGVTQWMAVAPEGSCPALEPWRELSGGDELESAWFRWSVESDWDNQRGLLRNGLPNKFYLWEVWERDGSCKDIVAKEGLSPTQAVTVLALWAALAYLGTFRFTVSDLLFLLHDPTAPDEDPRLMLSRMQTAGWVRLLPGDGIHAPTLMGPRGAQAIERLGLSLRAPQPEECSAPPCFPEVDPAEMDIEHDPEPLWTRDDAGQGQSAEGDAQRGTAADGDPLQGLVVCEEVRMVLEEALDAFRLTGKDEPPPSFMFYGPPGTGKTHAACILAKAMGRKLRAVTIPQVLSKWVGDTEASMAQHFEAAAKEGDLLFFDEADAFLRSRKEACRTYEITHVNTMLEMLDRRGAPVVFATNLESSLDEAVRRRIQWFVEFPIPGHEERIELWRLLAGCRNLKVEEGALSHLASLCLTGGLIKNAVARVASRNRCGRLKGTVEEALMAAGRSELPKMGDIGAATIRRDIGFASGAMQTVAPKQDDGF